MKNRCKGSGTTQMLSWYPDNIPTEEFPKGYPGAAVCIYCSGGILIVRGTLHKETSQTGFEGLVGRLRVHNEVE